MYTLPLHQRRWWSLTEQHSRILMLYRPWVSITSILSYFHSRWVTFHRFKWHWLYHGPRKLFKLSNQSLSCDLLTSIIIIQRRGQGAGQGNLYKINDTESQELKNHHWIIILCNEYWWHSLASNNKTMWWLMSFKRKTWAILVKYHRI